MSTLRQEVSKILGFTIQSGKWREAFDSLQKEARILPKHLIQIILLLCEREEQREKGE